MDYDPTYEIPRDFKVYVAGGRSRVIQVVNRSGSKNLWKHRFYDVAWTPYEDFQTSNLTDAVIDRPLGLNELIELADLVADDIGCFMRLDFYLTPRGPIFGEFTSYPNAGLHFTSTGERVLCELMDEYPDPF